MVRWRLGGSIGLGEIREVRWRQGWGNGGEGFDGENWWQMGECFGGVGKGYL